MKVHIAPDFRDVLRPLTDEERAGLTQSCLNDPKHERLPPIQVWGNAPAASPNIILDGHNQFAIRTKHRLAIKFVKVRFETRDEALAYSMAVQLNGRNISPGERAILAAKYAKLLPGGTKGQRMEEAAGLAGVSQRSIRRADKIIDAAPEEVAAVKRRETTLAAAEERINSASPKRRKPASLSSEDKPETGKAERNGSHKAEKEPEEAKPDPDSLEAVRADLEEAVQQIRAASGYLRKVFRCDGNEITRPYCGSYSLLSTSHLLLECARNITNFMPVGGTPKKPVLLAEQKAKELAGA